MAAAILNLRLPVTSGSFSTIDLLAGSQNGVVGFGILVIGETESEIAWVTFISWLRGTFVNIKNTAE